MVKIPKPAKFRETREKNVLDKPWPTHIPDLCPKCHASMKYKVNLFQTRSKSADLLHRFAPWLSVFVLLSIILIMTFAPPSFVEGGRGSPMALVAMVVGPSIILTIISNSIPKVIKLLCHQCKFTKNFPILKSKDTHDHYKQLKLQNERR